MIANRHQFDTKKRKTVRQDVFSNLVGAFNSILLHMEEEKVEFQNNGSRVGVRLLISARLR